MPEETWVFSCSDLHLSAPSDDNQRWVTHRLTENIKAHFDQPGVLVLNGDIVELWQPDSDVAKILQAHSDFWKLIYDYSQMPSHRVVYVVGNHDGELAWNDQAIAELEKVSGAKVTLELELSLSSSWQQKKIIFNHSHQLDADNAFMDPFDPNDFPFGKYVVQNIIPSAKSISASLFADIEHLTDRSAVGKVLWSRMFYKYLAPLVALSAFTLIFSAVLYDNFNPAISSWQEFVLFVLMIAMVLILITIFVVTVVASVKLNRTPVAHFGNTPGQKYLAQTNNETIGYVAGHTHHPELKKVKNKVYANSGFGNIGLVGYAGRIGLPNGFATVRNVSWVEFGVSQERIEATLTVVHQRLKASFVEKLLTKVPSSKPHTSQYTLSLPNSGGQS